MLNTHGFEDSYAFLSNLCGVSLFPPKEKNGKIRHSTDSTIATSEFKLEHGFLGNNYPS